MTDKRTVKLTIRLTQQEFNEIDEGAALDGKRTTDWARVTLLRAARNVSWLNTFRRQAGAEDD